MRRPHLDCPVRKIPAALAVLSLAAVGLAGCALPGASDVHRARRAPTRT